MNKKRILITSLFICGFVLIIMNLFLYPHFSKINGIPQHILEILALILSIGTMIMSIATFIRAILIRNGREIYKFDKLISYSKKRKELDEEIRLLTYELMNSDLSEYLDINRLIFQGQDMAVNNTSINYNTFLEQFGLSKEKLTMKEHSAIFLTPLTDEGERLFKQCCDILNSVGIFLQTTVNHVEKEDIMMNIVSLIVQSEIVIANIDGRNPNVYYELGIAHAIGKPTILLSKTNFDLNNIAFDIRQKRIIMYSSFEDLEKQLLYQVTRLVK